MEIGIYGLGRMGGNMAVRLAQGGHRVVASNRSRGPVDEAVQKGAAGFQRTVAIKHIKPEYRALKNYIDMFIEEARVGSELRFLKSPRAETPEDQLFS